MWISKSSNLFFSFIVSYCTLSTHFVFTVPQHALVSNLTRLVSFCFCGLSGKYAMCFSLPSSERADLHLLWMCGLMLAEVPVSKGTVCVKTKPTFSFIWNMLPELQLQQQAATAAWVNMKCSVKTSPLYQLFTLLDYQEKPISMWLNIPPKSPLDCCAMILSATCAHFQIKCAMNDKKQLPHCSLNV